MQRLIIVRDENADFPENSSIRVHTWHRRYSFGEKPKYTLGESVDHAERLEDSPHHLFKKLYAYDHSGLVLSFEPFECKLDSGLIGLMTPVVADFAWSKEAAEEGCKAYLDQINRWLAGEVYGYQIWNVCEHCDQNIDQDDSCYGFYSKEDIESYLSADMREQLDAAWGKRA